MSTVWGVVLVASLVIAVSAAWAAYRLLIRNGRLLLELRELHRPPRSPVLAGPTGLPAGCVLHDFDLPDLNGKRVTLSQWQGTKVLLIYLDPACPFSLAMLPDLATQLHSTPPEGFVPIVVTTGDPHQNRRLFAHHGIDCPVLVQENMELADLHAVAATPLAYLADEQAMTVGRPVFGAEAILNVFAPAAEVTGREIESNQFTRRVVRSRGESLVEYSGLPAGTPAPDFLLPGLDGNPLSLRARRGQRVLLLFLDPDYLPCRHLLSDLVRNAREEDPALQTVIVSRGSLEANREFVAECRITTPIGIQRYWDTSRAYQLMATPAAYLVDEGGSIARGVAFGRDAILDLVKDAATEREVVAV
jgi:peroxiredoxin